MDLTWRQRAQELTCFVLRAKFSHCPDAFDTLRKTANAIIAAHHDDESFWGIGHQEPNGTWKGENVYGTALMIVREHLMAQPPHNRDATKQHASPALINTRNIGSPFVTLVQINPPTATKSTDTTVLAVLELSRDVTVDHGRAIQQQLQILCPNPTSDVIVSIGKASMKTIEDQGDYMPTWVRDMITLHHPVELFQHLQLLDSTRHTDDQPAPNLVAIIRMRRLESDWTCSIRTCYNQLDPSNTPMILSLFIGT